MESGGWMADDGKRKTENGGLMMIDGFFHTEDAEDAEVLWREWIVDSGGWMADDGKRKTENGERRSDDE